MHIDNEKLLDILAEASGLDAETTQKQLAELIADIKQSLSEDEAYEIEGFGIFSSLGNRVMFIPAKELETEINFKYVGMEPIEMDEPKPSFEDPFEGLDDVNETKEIDIEAQHPVGKGLTTRFAGLIDEDIKDPDLEPAEDPGPEMWGVEAHKEEESADRLFASLMGQDYEEPIKEEEGIDASEENKFDGFDDIFTETDNASDSDDLGSEVAAFMGDDTSMPKKDELSTDDILDDVFSEMEGDGLDSDDGDDDILDLGSPDVVIDYAEVPESDDMDDFISVDLHSISAEEEEERTHEDDETKSYDDEVEAEAAEPFDPQNANDSTTDDDLDFEDPFMNLEDDQIDESVLRMEEFDDTEIVPVIKNITSEQPKDGIKEEQHEVAEEKPEKKKEKESKKKPSSNNDGAPAWLWVLLIVVVLGGGVVGLGYFNILNIPFISSGSASVAQNNTVTNATPPPVVNATPAQQNAVSGSKEENPTATSQAENDSQVAEQASEPVVDSVQPVQNTTSTNAEKYGLTGNLSESGMDGYTIVMYSLSNQQNALAEQQKLQDNGYRVLVLPIESERFGTLWRVSLGQFASLFDAAVAAEDIETLLPDNYFIKKIN